MMKYFCPICNTELDTTGSNVHNHFVYELGIKFEKNGYSVIQEGKIPEEFRAANWCEPDLFILKKGKLEKIIEVIVADSYENGGRSVESKGWKIKNYYNPFEIIMFEPTNYLNSIFLNEEKKEQYKEIIGFEPNSYEEIEKYYSEKWKAKGLEIIFWNEDDLKEI